MTAELLALVSVAELQELAGVNRTTAARWKRQESRLPFAVARLVLFRYGCELAAVWGAQWSGWRIGRDGALYAPGWRRPFTPGEVLALPYLYGQIAALKRATARRAEPRPCRLPAFRQRPSRARPA